ncbi:MAG: pilus assembly protein [Erysipelotrichaceae bacterium]|nr:pilus assembly protein [Erysipelotrichaceae bacterium]
MPILIMLLSMVVDLARIVDAKILINNAASEAVRYLVERDDPGAVSTILSVNYGDRLDMANISYTVEDSPVQTINYRYYPSYSYSYYNATMKYKNVKISIEYKVDLIMPLSKIVFGSDFVVVDSWFTSRVGVK